MPGTSSKRERKRQILQAAGRTFRRLGLQQAGMRDIAREADMQVSNLYYYFQNKQEILAYCQQQALGSLQAQAERIIALDLPADVQLYILMEAHVELLNEGLPGSLAHLEVDLLEEPWKGAILQRRDRYESVLRDILRRGIGDGIFRGGDPKVRSLAILGALNWTVRWYRLDGPRSAREIGSEFAELLVRGLLVEGRAWDPERVKGLDRRAWLVGEPPAGSARSRATG